jgi:hypothetical protein
LTGEYTEIQVLPTGIYRVRYKRMTPSQLKAMRTRTRNEVTELRRKLNHHLLVARELDLKLEDLERILNESESPDVEAFLERWEESKEEAEARAEQYLKEFLGDDGYEEFRERGWLELEDRYGDLWRVRANGETYKWVEGGLKRVCIVRPRGLPLPDHVVSVITSIQESPENYTNIRR